jgi:ribonuclease HII
VLDYHRLGPAERRSLKGLDDSKAMDPELREELYPRVFGVAARVGVAVRAARGIDSRGLHVTNLAALGRCLEQVAPPDAICLVDGFRVPSAVQHEAIVEGDARSAAIAAASVVAKVTRDRYMRRADSLYPGFGFAGNVGYSTPEHRQAIVARGVCDIHRRSFQSIAYVQMELAGDSEGGADVLELHQVPGAVEYHADGVESQLADAAGDAALG